MVGVPLELGLDSPGTLSRGPGRHRVSPWPGRGVGIVQKVF